LTTEEVAAAARAAPQTVRKNHSQAGHYLGIRPIKSGRRLLWPADEVAAALTRRSV
jgi:hypothetical protein